MAIARTSWMSKVCEGGRGHMAQGGEEGGGGDQGPLGQARGVQIIENDNRLVKYSVFPG